MASRSIDTSCEESDSGRAESGGGGHAADTLDETGAASASDETAPPAVIDPAADVSKVEDQELIEMLEQLNETLDSAQSVLNEHQMLAAEAVRTEADMAPPLAAPQANSALTPLLAAGLGVCIGAVGLALLWPLWNPPPDRQPAAGLSEPAVHETRMGRSVHISPPAGETIVPVKLPDALPLAKKAPDRLPEPVQKVVAALTASSQPPAVPAGAATGQPPDKPDFEAKDETMPAPPPQPEQVTASAVEGKPARPALSAEEANSFIAKGNALLTQGDVASARLVFEYAATRGNADAMFALARSYDPRFLGEHGAVGIKPDVKTALDWYGRAAQNGNDQADAMADGLETLAMR